MKPILKFCLLLLLLPIRSIMAQVQFMDERSEQPIPSVNVYHKKGNLIGFSTKEGFLEFIPEGKNNISYPLEVYIQHVAYENATLKIANAQDKQTLRLIPRENRLPEIVMRRPDAEFVCIRGYFRSLETYNLQHKYFADGIMEFYIPLQKGTVRYKILEYRVYRDSAVVKDYNEKMGPFFQAPRVVDITAGKLSDRLTKLEQRAMSDSSMSLQKKNTEVGYMRASKQHNSLSFYQDEILPDSLKLQKIFRLEAKVRHAVTIENYANPLWSDVRPQDLKDVYQVVSGSIKRKAEFGHIPYEVVNEFYVMDRRFLTAAAYKKIRSQLTRNSYKVPLKSNYKERYWENLAPYAIAPINPGLAVQLGNNLKLIDN